MEKTHMKWELTSYKNKKFMIMLFFTYYEAKKDCVNSTRTSNQRTLQSSKIDVKCSVFFPLSNCKFKSAQR